MSSVRPADAPEKGRVREDEISRTRFGELNPHAEL